MRKMKKLGSLFLALVMTLNMSICSFAAEGDPSVTLAVDKEEVTVGENVTVTLSVDQAVENVNVFSVKLTADKDVFDVVSVDTTFRTTDSLAEKGFIKLAKIDSEGNNVTVSDDFATVVLKAKQVTDTTSIGITELQCSKTLNQDPWAEAVEVNAPSPVSLKVKEAPAFEGYGVHGGLDVTTTSGGSAIVSVYATHSDKETVKTYNAYDVIMTYDADKLEYDSCTPADEDARVIANNGEIRVIGYGKDKTYDTAVTTLTFKFKDAEGAAAIVITSAKVSDKAAAIEDDAKEVAIDGGQDSTPDEIIVAVPYSVEKPDFVEGDATVLPGEDYTFRYADTDNYAYSGLKVFVDGIEVIPVANTDGSYTISEVNGKVKIEATQKANEYSVTFIEVKDVTYNGDEKATYGIDYEFTVSTTKEGYKIGKVTAAYENKKGEVTVTVGENGKYIIEGSQIIDDIKVTAELIDAGTHTTINFTGEAAEDVVGGTQQIAKIGEAFTFELNEKVGYTYTVKIAEKELQIDGATGKYTIPAADVTSEGVTVTVTKELIVETTVNVDEYITLNGGKVMYLITAEKGTSVLAYGEDTMYRSSSYGDAYCWLVVSDKNQEDILTEAKEKIAVTTNTADTIAYDFDVNKTGEVDINDAQLTYDMYTAEYASFDKVSMDKFLEADLNADKKVSTDDAVAIVNQILNRFSGEN